jgi:hypothetical protein
VGFSLILDDGNETVAYGWVEVTFQNNDNTPGVIHGWAYDDTGAAARSWCGSRADAKRIDCSCWLGRHGLAPSPVLEAIQDSKKS